MEIITFVLIAQLDYSQKQQNQPYEGLVVCCTKVKTLLVVLECSLVRYSQLLASLCTTRCQNLAAISSCHSRTESVLVDSLATRRLISSLHCHSRIVFIVFVLIIVFCWAHNAPLRGAKVQLNLKRANIFWKKLKKASLQPSVLPYFSNNSLLFSKDNLLSNSSNLFC